ncbi:MAG: thiosulfate oxidation carrier protein SoxY [Gammaproteobacteria bacterium]|jgi:sulfur-oxidizing protein SoxY
MKRRVFVKGSVAAGTLAVAAGAGLLSPTRVLAAAWPESAFGPRPEADALNAFFGTSEVMESDQVMLKAPLQAENGAVVPIKVMTTLSDVESIAVIVEKNPAPFTTGLEVMGGGAGAMYSARIKMGQTSPVKCYVKAGGKVYMTAQEIKVTVGGCGG